MKRWFVALVLLVGVGAAAWLVAPHGAAQVGGSQDDKSYACRSTQFDLTNDGVLSKADLTAWTDLAVADGCLQTSLDDNEACKVYDYNDDRFIDDTDVAVAHERFISCIVGPAQSRGR